MLGFGAWRAAVVVGEDSADLGQTSGSCGWELSGSSSANVSVDLLACPGTPTLLGAPVEDMTLRLTRDGEPMWAGAVDSIEQDPSGRTLTLQASDWTSQAAGFPILGDVVAPLQTTRPRADMPGAPRPVPLHTPTWDIGEFLSEALAVAGVPRSSYNVDRYGLNVQAAIAYDAGVDVAQALTSVADLLNWTVVDGVLRAEPIRFTYAPPTFSAVPPWWVAYPTIRTTAGHVTRVTAVSTTAFTSRRRHLRVTVVDEEREAVTGRRNERIISSVFSDESTLNDAAARALVSFQSGTELGSVALSQQADVHPHDLHPGAPGEIATGTSPLSYEGPCTIARVLWSWQRGEENENQRPQVTFAHPSVSRRTRPGGSLTIGSIAADHERRLKAVENNGVPPAVVADVADATSQLIERLAPLGIFDV